MAVRTWRCRRVKAGVKCDTLNLRIKQRCTKCGGPRPRRRVPAHRAALASMTYAQCVSAFGERCGICGAGPTTKRLQRDHEHKGAGAIRGLLCFQCNVDLRDRMTLTWLRGAVAYLERFETQRETQREARREEIT